MIYTAEQKNPETKCWIVKHWLVEYDSAKDHVIVDNAWVRPVRDDDYRESEVWGAATEAEAIQMAKERDGL